VEWGEEGWNRDAGNSEKERDCDYGCLVMHADGFMGVSFHDCGFGRIEKGPKCGAKPLAEFV
jgi:hypothetical protein